ncbi:hypothetical protein GJU41_11945 [Bacillus idriensis]|uniref:Uncharacterized protein n=1 Tax=Metabacillus idriensis TaxID=324768 RepID=A0A6I2M8P3_9BACI|nr:hypothetical protein [Metabacillus idriensis]MRX54685.1 hypothetical protein [Metabacillus idriensis]
MSKNATPNTASPTFQWISNENYGNGSAYVTIDKQQRLYLSTGTRSLLKLGPSGKGIGIPANLIVGYDGVNKRLIIAKPEVVRATDVKPFKFDARSYSSARNFVGKIGIKANELPLRFVHVGREYGAYPAGAEIFQLDDYEAPDEVGRG